MFTPSDISFTLEVFPPKTDDGLERLMKVVEDYATLRPACITVTFGAGGSDENVAFARRVLSLIPGHASVPVAAHLTCANRSRDSVNAIVDQFWTDGIRRVVALRGDMHNQSGPYHPFADGYATTPEFIAAMRSRYAALHIAVAGYPETHPESPSEDFDIDHLKRKVDAGADEVLTQFFFDPDVFLRWRDKVTARGITAPLVPGLLPILNFPKMCAMAARCNAHVPGFLLTMFDKVDPESVDHKILAMNVLSHQITRLIEHGVKLFHFYTMNETMLTRHLCTWMRAGF